MKSTPWLGLAAGLIVSTLSAETRTLGLRQVVDLALRQNPDLIVARLDEQKASLEVQAVTEPLIPRTVIGSGLAYTSGFPLSIEGSAPSVIRAQATRSLWDPVKSYQQAQTRELARGATIRTAATREDVALRTTVLFLDLEKLSRSLIVARRQLENLERIDAVVRQRVAEGRELEIENKRSKANVARAKQRILVLEGQVRVLGRSLAMVVGLDSADTIIPAAEERTDPALPAGEEESIQEALAQSKEIQRLESDLLAKGFEAKSYRASRLPKIDLVAQYALFAKFNNYDQYFNTFQRHNGQVGASIQVPVFPDAAQEARAAQTDLEARRLQAEIRQTRGKIQDETRKGWERLKEAESLREVSRLDLEVAREQVSVTLAQMEEGRATLRQVEEARFLENERWLAYYDSRYAVERAKWEVLKSTNSLLAALR